MRNLVDLLAYMTLQLESQPNSFKALSIRASSYMKKKMYQEAVEDYRLVLQQDPEVRSGKICVIDSVCCL